MDFHFVKKKDFFKEFIFYASAPGLLPLTIMFFLYSRNWTQIDLYSILLDGGFLSLLIFLLYFLCRFILDRFTSQMLSFTGVFLIFFFARYCDLVRPIFLHGIILSYGVFMALCVGIVVFLCHFLKKYKSEMVHKILLFCSVSLFLINTFQATVTFIRTRAEIDKAKLCYFPDRKNSPNIYWIHADGMLGFEAFNKYYKDDQKTFSDFLNSKDFFINRNAEFEACHQTMCAIAALHCPDFYDQVLAKELRTHKKAIEFSTRLPAELLAYHRLCKNELYESFLQKGYSLRFVPDLPNYHLYRLKNKDATSHLLRLKPNLFLNTNDFTQEVFDFLGCFLPSELFLYPLTAFEGNFVQLRGEGKIFEEELDFLKNRDILSYYSRFFKEFLNIVKARNYQRTANLIVCGAFFSHFPYLYNVSGRKIRYPDLDGNGSTLPEHYRDQHILTTRILMAVIRMILKKDPDAVIILQGDHGLHGTTLEQFKEYFGKDCNYVELWNQVISAVRIPEKYRTGEEHFLMQTPLNITRYLINSFVQKNRYGYIIEKEIKNVH